MIEPKTVAAVVIGRMAPLDLFGPMQAFMVAAEPDPANPEIPPIPTPKNSLYRVITVGREAGPIPVGGVRPGPHVEVQYAFEDAPEYDILLIPGGPGVRDLVGNPDFIGALKNACLKADVVASVCTGAALLASTGLLDGKRATTNKTAWKWVVGQGPNVNWECPPRWVDEIDPARKTGFITSGGVAAGIDMALGLIARLDGLQVAKNVSVLIEHAWNNDPTDDPFEYLCPGPGE